MVRSGYDEHFADITKCGRFHGNSAIWCVCAIHPCSSKLLDVVQLIHVPTRAQKNDFFQDRIRYEVL